MKKEVFMSSRPALNLQAESLNRLLREDNPEIYTRLSEKGRRIFFPETGIMAQSLEAKDCPYNATIGTAVEEDGAVMSLSAVTDQFDLPAEEALTYASSFGLPALRKEWKRRLKEKNPSLREENCSLPVVTQALSHGLSLAAFLFMDEGDELLIPEPFWGNYKLIFSESRGVEIRSFPLFKTEGSALVPDWEELEKQLTRPVEGRGKRILLLNFPNNPCGYSPRVEEAEILLALLKRSVQKEALTLIVDDAYFGLNHEPGIFPESLFGRAAQLDENLFCIKVDGPTKEDFVWGLRVGFITYASKGLSLRSREVLEKKTAGALRGSISNVSRLTQNLLLKAYENPSYASEKKEKIEILHQRYQAVKSYLNENPSFLKEVIPYPFNSGYFLCFRLKKAPAEELRKTLLQEFGIGVIAFPGNIIRVTYSAVSLESIPFILEKIREVSKRLSS